MDTTVHNLIASKQIPALEEVQMQALLHHLFTSAESPLRIAIAEIAYRYDHDHPKAQDLFLACTMPLAEKAATRKANKIFLYPSDWQIELMYDGAVEAAVNIYQSHHDVQPGTDSFRRYLLRALSRGTLRNFFRRDENSGIRSVGDLGTVSVHSKPLRNNIEQDVITRELLHQVTNYPDLPPFVRKTLKCIAELGPDVALKEHAFTKSGDPDKWKRDRGGTPILNPLAIAKARGVSTKALHFQLWKARVVLRQAFNADGRLFFTR